MTKLIILRGNSGSGKTTTGKALNKNLLDEFNNQIFAYYIDIQFKETLNRHKLKPNANEFGEKELRKWWNEKDLLDIIPEV